MVVNVACGSSGKTLRLERQIVINLTPDEAKKVYEALSFAKPTNAAAVELLGHLRAAMKRIP